MARVVIVKIDEWAQMRLREATGETDTADAASAALRHYPALREETARLRGALDDALAVITDLQSAEQTRDRALGHYRNALDTAARAGRAIRAIRAGT